MSSLETYTIEDCIRYDDTSRTSTSAPNWTLPSTYTLEFIVRRTSTVSNSGYIVIGANTTGDRVLTGQFGATGLNGVWVNKNNSWESQNNASNNTPINTDNKYVFKYDGSGYTFSNGTNTLTGTITGVTMTNLAQIYIQSTTVKNIKIKPL